MLRLNRRLTADPSSLIWMLVALAVGSGSARPARGEDAAAREPDATVVVTATRLLDAEIPPGDVPAHVTVITREQIAASGARTLQDVLTLAAGVVVYDQTGNGIQQTVDLRGFSGGRSCAVFTARGSTTRGTTRSPSNRFLSMRSSGSRSRAAPPRRWRGAARKRGSSASRRVAGAIEACP